jgi:4a-hydroxytetrahydrobiopterin dehydratase
MDNWKNRNKDKMLEARFEFSDYDKLRDFLDLLAEKADAVEHHPNVSFGKNYASVAIYAKNEILADVDFDLAKSINNAFETINKS